MHRWERWHLPWCWCPRCISPKGRCSWWHSDVAIIPSNKSFQTFCLNLFWGLWLTGVKLVLGFLYCNLAVYCLKLIPHIYLSSWIEACILLQSFKAVLCQQTPCPFNFFLEMYQVGFCWVTGWNLWKDRFSWNGGLLMTSALSFHPLWPEELYSQICLALGLPFLSTHSLPSRKSQMYSWAFAVYFRALQLAKTVLFYTTDCLNLRLLYTHYLL